MSALADRGIVRVMTISQATDLWLGELERKGESKRTVETYRRLLDKLADGYRHLDVEELTTTMLRRFLDNQSRRLKDGGRKADATLAQNVTVVNTFMDWLSHEGLIRQNPTRRNGLRILERPRLAPAEENDSVVTVTSADVAKLLKAADESGSWNKRLAVNGLVYLGPRRRALAQARISDYDADSRTLAFGEKGGKLIRKPVPDRLAELIEAAVTAGIYEGTDSYLVPGNGPQRRSGPRDDRVIWRLVREVAAEAGVTTHVHALRAAFAVHFLERKPGELVALKDLMGHRRIETTLVYLRRLNRLRSMETVRDLDWSPETAATDSSGRKDPRTVAGAPATESSYRAAGTSKQIARKPLEALLGAEKEGFEPSLGANPDAVTAGSQPEESVPQDRAQGSGRTESPSGLGIGEASLGSVPAPGALADALLEQARKAAGAESVPRPTELKEEAGRSDAL